MAPIDAVRNYDTGGVKMSFLSVSCGNVRFSAGFKNSGSIIDIQEVHWIKVYNILSPCKQPSENVNPTKSVGDALSVRARVLFSGDSPRVSQPTKDDAPQGTPLIEQMYSLIFDIDLWSRDDLASGIQTRFRPMSSR